MASPVSSVTLPLTCFSKAAVLATGKKNFGVKAFVEKAENVDFGVKKKCCSWAVEVFCMHSDNPMQVNACKIFFITGSFSFGYVAF
jgi:hypothetical protein